MLFKPLKWKEKSFVEWLYQIGGESVRESIYRATEEELEQLLKLKEQFRYKKYKKSGKRKYYKKTMVLDKTEKKTIKLFKNQKPDNTKVKIGEIE